MADYLFERRDDLSANTVRDISINEIKKLYEDNNEEAEEVAKITLSAYLGNNHVGNGGPGWENGLIFDYLYQDPRVSGYLMFYPHGTVIHQGMRRNLYRGENQIYPTSVPTLVRKLRSFNTVKEKELYRLVADMRIYEFSVFLDRFQHVQNWKKHSDVLYEALAQHYGLETNWMDITSDFNVALFFANCYYKNGKWYPLTDAETEVDENHKYGMIFHAPSYKMATRLVDEFWCQYSPIASIPTECDDAGKPTRYESVLLEHPIYRAHPQNMVLPIGFQPFMRCSMQSGYGIYMRDELPLQNDWIFEKLRFRHNEGLARWIYEEMDEGRKIYPHEGLLKAQYVIDQIKNLYCFSYDAFRYAVYRSHYYRLSDIKIAREDLKSFTIDGHNIELVSYHPWKINWKHIRNIDSAYKDFSLEAAYGVLPISRKNMGNKGLFAPWMLMSEKNEPGVIDFCPLKSSYDVDSISSRIGMELMYLIKFAKEPDFY